MRDLAPNTSMTTPRAFELALALVAVLAVAASACSGGSSDTNAASREAVADEGAAAGAESQEVPAEAREFCAVLDEAVEISADRKDQYDASEGVLAQMVTLSAAVGDMQVQLRRLQDVAPDDIARDVEAVADSLDVDPSLAAENPLAVIGSALATGMMAQGSFERLDAYALDNCGMAVFGTTTVQRVVEVTPKRNDDGSVVVDLANVAGESRCDDARQRTDQYGRDGVALNGYVTWDKYAVLVCYPDIVSIDLENLGVAWTATMDGDQSLESTVREGLVLVVESVEAEAASGLTSAKHVHRVIARDVATGHVLWTREVDLESEFPDYTPIDVASVGSTGTVVLRYEKPRDGPLDLDAESPSRYDRKLVAVGRDGSEKWTTDSQFGGHLGDGGTYSGVTPLKAIHPDYIWLGGIGILDTGRTIVEVDRAEANRCATVFKARNGPVPYTYSLVSADGRTAPRPDNLVDVVADGWITLTEDELAYVTMDGQQWSRPVDGITAAVHGGYLFANNGDTTLILDPHTGEQLDDEVVGAREGEWAYEPWTFDYRDGTQIVFRPAERKPAPWCA